MGCWRLWWKDCWIRSGQDGGGWDPTKAWCVMILPLVDAIWAFDAALNDVVHPQRSLCCSGLLCSIQCYNPRSRKGDSLGRVFWICGPCNATAENCQIAKLRPLSLSLSLSLSHTHIYFFRILFRYTILHLFKNRAHHIAVGLADPPQTRNCHCTDATITKGNGRCFW